MDIYNSETMADQDHTRQENNGHVIRIGSLTVNRHTHTAHVEDRPVTLSPAEFDLLWFLASRAGEIITRDELYQEILKTEYDGLNRCLDLRISRIRKKLGDNRASTHFIKSIRSEGYLLVRDCG